MIPYILKNYVIKKENDYTWWYFFILKFNIPTTVEIGLILKLKILNMKEE